MPSHEPLLPSTTQAAAAAARRRHGGAPPARRPAAAARATAAAAAVLLLVALAGWRRLSSPAGTGAAGADPRALLEEGGPSAGGPGGLPEMFAAAGAPPFRLLLATHSRLLWYYPETGESRVLHEGQGVYYGVFPGEEKTPAGGPAAVWVVSRPHNWRAAAAAAEGSGARREALLKLDIETGAELATALLDTQFAHDAARSGAAAWVADTGRGRLVELALAPGGGLERARDLPLFAPEQHANTVAPYDGAGTLWVVLHSLGASRLAEVDLAAGVVLRTLGPVGDGAHGLVFLAGRAGRVALTLDSGAGALVAVDLASGAVEPVWSAGGGAHLKGLAVVDGVAYVGVSPVAPRAARAAPGLACELAAVDLRAPGGPALLWRRPVPSRGLLNAVAAPHLAVESTAHEVLTQRGRGGDGGGGGGGGYRATRDFAAAAARARPAGLATGAVLRPRAAGAAPEPPPAPPPAVRLALSEAEAPRPGSAAAGHPRPLLGGRWPSGLPFLDLWAKQRLGLAAGAQLLLARLDVGPLAAALAAAPEAEWGDAAARASNAVIEGRAAVLERFKPGTQAIQLLFSDRGGRRVYVFPWYRQRYASLVDPLVDALLGPGGAARVTRLQLARLPPGAQILPHVDAGGYSERGHRLHVVVATNAGVEFTVCGREGGGPGARAERCVPLEVGEPGLAFELNNRLRHGVANRGGEARVHLVVDVAEEPRPRTDLRVGQVCMYGEVVKC